MKALLAGLGGIGSNVYLPELNKLGYDVETLDNSMTNATFSNINQIDKTYDLAVICTPNFTHEEIARRLAELDTRRIFVEKPGVSTSHKWRQLVTEFPEIQFHLVKNNLYRSDYGQLITELQARPHDLIGVDISWLNGNRIPNPGSWFTNKKCAFGGVSRDLMPHLYCFAVKIFGENKLANAQFQQACFQRWNLSSISSTDYGVVHSDGIYDVDDTALAAAVIGNVSLKLSASWKEGYDKQSITLFFRDGSTYEWNFGLCPAEAYGAMLQDIKRSDSIDTDIHVFLENFND